MTIEQMITIGMLSYFLIGIFVMGIDSVVSISNKGTKPRMYLIFLWAPYVIFISIFGICVGTYKLGQLVAKFVIEIKTIFLCK